jgi:ornithine decarboxylase
MSLIRNRAAVGPLHRHISLRADSASTLATVAGTVRTLRPEEPLYCTRPGVIAASSRAFVSAFNGDVLYAVKCNPEPAVLRAIWEGGVRHFDCASISEVSLVRRLFPGAEIHFMHPVKSRTAIREAWVLNGVRDFVLDSEAELNKILNVIATRDAAALNAQPGLFIRLALPKTSPRNSARSLKPLFRSCARRGRWRGDWAWRSMSARNAWTHSPGAMPWRSRER